MCVITVYKTGTSCVAGVARVLLFSCTLCHFCFVSTNVGAMHTLSWHWNEESPHSKKKGSDGVSEFYFFGGGLFSLREVRFISN